MGLDRECGLSRRHYTIPDGFKVARTLYIAGLNRIQSEVGGFVPTRRIHPEGLITSCKRLLFQRFILNRRRGGFQVDSPVRNPVASKMARSAPPYTDRAREEPWRGAPAVPMLRVGMCSPLQQLVQLTFWRNQVASPASRTILASFSGPMSVTRPRSGAAPTSPVCQTKNMRCTPSICAIRST